MLLCYSYQFIADNYQFYSFMGCVSGQSKTNELKPKNDSNNAIPTSLQQPQPLVQDQHSAGNPPQQPHPQLNHQPNSSIHKIAGKPTSKINPPSNIVDEAGSSNIPNNYIQNRPITVNDINVSGLNHIADKVPSSSIPDMQSHDYAPSGIAKRSRVNEIGIHEQENTIDEDVVHSEGGANFTPSVRNINFHIQIS